MTRKKITVSEKRLVLTRRVRERTGSSIRILESLAGSVLFSAFEVRTVAGIHADLGVVFDEQRNHHLGAGFDGAFTHHVTAGVALDSGLPEERR